MAYCTNCGNQLRDGAKFCDSCGKSVASVNDCAQRQTTYEGKIHKCPNCGEIVEAFQDDCPTCGYQFRDTTVTSSVKELVDKLQQIENEPKGLNLADYFLSNGLSQKVRKQVSLINNYTIPNTYEDIWEFLILSSSRIKNDNTDVVSTPASRALSDAWKAKFDQAYHKAMLVIDTPEDIQRIKDLYSKTQNKAAKNQIKRMSIIILPFAGMIFICLLFSVMAIIFSASEYSDYVDKENERLNAIVSEVYECIDTENYTLARTKAVTLVFKYYSDKTESDDEARQQWDETRKDLLEIIDNAEQESKKQTNTGGK